MVVMANDQFITQPAQNPLLKKVLSHIKPMAYSGQKAILYHWTSANTIIRHNLLEAGLTEEIGATRVWPQAFLCSLLDLSLERKECADGLHRTDQQLTIDQARADFMSGQLSNEHILYQLSNRNLGPRIICTPMPKALEALRSGVVRWIDTSAEEKYFGRESNIR